MFASMGWDPTSPGLDGSGWWATVRDRIAEHRPAELAVFVVDVPGSPPRSGEVPSLAACGAGTVVRRLPSPRAPDGRAGYVQWMSTDPAWQRQGFARAVLRRLVAWYDALGVGNVELHATEAGAVLYRSEGFWEGTGAVALRRRRWDPPPEAMLEATPGHAPEAAPGDAPEAAPGDAGGEAL
jgi:GNAT superfamily N-acetyltransferase